MIAGLKPYAEMKDSEVPWLGSLPKHWLVRPNRALFSEIKSRDTVDEQMLSVTIKRGVIAQRDLLSDSSKKDSSRQDKSAYKLVCPGDVAYNKMRAWQGAVGVSGLRGIVSPAYVVMRSIGHVVPRYFHYLLRTPAFAKEAERWSYGITSDMWSLRPEHFKLICCCVPPVEEQAAIVRFLDYADRRIRRAIAAKQKLIRLLEEQKQAIIHRAVTRGLDPDVRLKPSGIEWLGDVPEHWAVLAFARVVVDGPRNGISPSIHENGDVESFSIAAIRNGKVDVRDADKKYVSGDKSALTQAYSLRQGDVLIVRGNGNVRLVGKAGLVEIDMPNRVYPDLLMRVRMTQKCTPTFAVALLGCRSVRDQIETFARTAVGTFKINNQQVRQLRIALPPVSEQEVICDWISKVMGSLDRSQRRFDREIALLREYRTRLIADVVTGKLDVREAAAKLPESPEPELADDEALDAEGDDDASQDEAIAEDAAA